MYDEVDNNFLVVDAILKGESKLTDKFQIETVLEAIQSLRKKTDFLKELKKRRVEAIDSELHAHASDISVLENAVIECMSLHSEKTLNFPGIGKVQLRKIKGSWQINDEDNLKQFLEENKLVDDVVENSWRFKLKDLYKVLNKLEENNNVPNSVSKGQDDTSISISFAKSETSAVKPQVAQTNSDTVDFDKLVI